MPEDLEKVLTRCRSMIEVGSKSFSLAAKTFPKEHRNAAMLLYGWCRHCDDEIDLADNQSFDEKMARLENLRSQTTRAYEGGSLSHPVFEAFSHIAKAYRIPKHYPFELLEGMEMDIRRQTYETFDDLTLYCYRVAGTVGLMMSHIMGVSDDAALSRASDLGIAMQLTNISRDVVEDAAMDRVYLPLNWVRELGVSPTEVSHIEHRVLVSQVVRRLLEQADAYYCSGDAGLKFLSFRSACTISAARNIYSEIGKKVRQKGPAAWDDRVFVSTPRKVVLLLKAIIKEVVGLPARVSKGWIPKRIEMIWRHV